MNRYIKTTSERNLEPSGLRGVASSALLLLGDLLSDAAGLSLRASERLRHGPAEYDREDPIPDSLEQALMARAIVRTAKQGMMQERPELISYSHIITHVAETGRKGNPVRHLVRLPPKQLAQFIKEGRLNLTLNLDVPNSTSPAAAEENKDTLKATVKEGQA